MNMEDGVLATRGRRPGKPARGPISAFIYAIRSIIPSIVLSFREARRIYRGARKAKAGYDALVPVADPLLNAMERLGLSSPTDDLDKVALYKTESGQNFTNDQLHYLDNLSDKEREELKKRGGFVPDGSVGRVRLACTIDDDQAELLLAQLEAMEIDGYELSEGDAILKKHIKKRLQARYVGLENEE